MLRRKHDFKPDKMGAGILNKLYITKKQRLTALRWLLYGIVLVLCCLTQDVILCRLSIRGATTDLMAAAILLLCIMLPADSGAVFAVVCSTVYYFSGMTAGPYVIVFLTGLGVLLNFFRSSYLRKSFGTTFLCAGAALMLYELMLFVAGLFLGYTTAARFPSFCITGGISLAFLPVLYPIFLSVGKIGGESWKE